MRNSPKIRAVAVVILFLVAGSLGSIAQPVAVPIEESHWILNDWKRWPQNAPASAFGEYNGRRSLYVASGLAIVRDVEMQDGTIEAEVAADPRGAFFGLAFRVESPRNFELIYIRPASSGTLEAVQYTPNLNGAIAWQLYHGAGFQAAADFRLDRWMHVKIDVSGSTASLYLDGSSSPTLVVHHLSRSASAGAIGFWGLFGGGHIADLKYERSTSTTRISDDVSQPMAGRFESWQLSKAFDAGKVSPLKYPDVSSLTWDTVKTEPSGMLVINRYRESPEIMPPPPRAQMTGVVPGSRVVFARAVIHSGRQEVVPMWIGYSDEAVVYLNGKRLFSGKNAWRYRDEGAGLGLVDYNDRVYLPLREGNNELLVAVTEFMGGWGLLCRLDKDH